MEQMASPRGYAEEVEASENCPQNCWKFLPEKYLMEKKVDVRSATWQNLPQFEAGAQNVNVFESQEWK
eukprot:bmy_06185T0